MINSEVKYNSLILRLKETYRKQSLLDFTMYLIGGISLISITFLLFTLIAFFVNGSIDFRTKLFYSFLGFSLITLLYP